MARRSAFLFTMALLAAAAIGSWNYLALQRHASSTLSDDPRNAGIKFRAHYEWFVNPRVVVFDLRDVSGGKSALDVSRTLLQFSERLKESNYDRVILSFKGTPRFTLKGDYFHTLGSEYERQNPVYTLRTLPENVYNLDGTPEFGTWTGGLLGVVGKQMEDLSEFHRRWYMSSIESGS